MKRTPPHAPGHWRSLKFQALSKAGAGTARPRPARENGRIDPWCSPYDAYTRETRIFRIANGLFCRSISPIRNRRSCRGSISGAPPRVHERLAVGWIRGLTPSASWVPHRHSSCREVHAPFSNRLY